MFLFSSLRKTSFQNKMEFQEKLTYQSQKTFSLSQTSYLMCFRRAEAATGGVL